jgi:hypothetical protein
VDQVLQYLEWIRRDERVYKKKVLCKRANTGISTSDSTIYPVEKPEDRPDLDRCGTCG